jgi:hypothetical protein
MQHKLSICFTGNGFRVCPCIHSVFNHFILINLKHDMLLELALELQALSVVCYLAHSSGWWNMKSRKTFLLFRKL